ncbi:hypothetical protein BDA96_05G237100 [Sorghum bicolor]|uniref:Knottin scorpion toxin-like domain-containing protein n=3 Tax=Sorghum bicolor TaxID=4558 RepID=A0A921QZB5_SORBI|nr:hypothetical protein BDA96_05G237100 [Sorghum bicolor]OQU84051.1 hypothetical protein SORBI_3005G221200 [Sorghum bicolor]
MALSNTPSSSMHSMATAVLVALLVASALVSSTYAEFGKMECIGVNYNCNQFPGSRKCGDSCRDKARSQGSSSYSSKCQPAVAPFQCCCTVKDPHHPWPPSS